MKLNKVFYFTILGSGLCNLSEFTSYLNEKIDKVDNLVKSYQESDGMTGAGKIQEQYEGVNGAIYFLANEIGARKASDIDAESLTTVTNSISKLFGDLTDKKSTFDTVGISDSVSKDIYSVIFPAEVLVNTTIKMTSSDCNVLTSIIPPVKAIKDNFSSICSVYNVPQGNFPSTISCTEPSSSGSSSTEIPTASEPTAVTDMPFTATTTDLVSSLSSTASISASTSYGSSGTGISSSSADLAAEESSLGNEGLPTDIPSGLFSNLIPNGMGSATGSETSIPTSSGVSSIGNQTATGISSSDVSVPSGGVIVTESTYIPGTTIPGSQGTGAGTASSVPSDVSGFYPTNGFGNFTIERNVTATSLPTNGSASVSGSGQVVSPSTTQISSSYGNAIPSVFPSQSGQASQGSQGCPSGQSCPYPSLNFTMGNNTISYPENSGANVRFNWWMGASAFALFGVSALI